MQTDGRTRRQKKNYLSYICGRIGLNGRTVDSESQIEHRNSAESQSQRRRTKIYSARLLAGSFYHILILYRPEVGTTDAHLFRDTVCRLTRASTL